MIKLFFNIYTSDYSSANKFGVQEEENNDKEKSEIDDLIKMNEKILKKQELLKAKNNINKEYLFWASRDKTIKLWDVIGGVCIFIFIGHDNWVRSLCQHPNRKYIVSCSDDKSIR